MRARVESAPGAFGDQVGNGAVLDLCGVKIGAIQRCQNRDGEDLHVRIAHTLTGGAHYMRVAMHGQEVEVELGEAAHCRFDGCADIEELHVEENTFAVFLFQLVGQCQTTACEHSEADLVDGDRVAQLVRKSETFESIRDIEGDYQTVIGHGLALGRLVSCRQAGVSPRVARRPGPPWDISGSMERQAVCMKDVMRSVLEIHELETGRSHVVLETTQHLEAPNWDAARAALVVNSGGRLYRVPLAGGDPVQVETGDLSHLNNDHGLSPDGALLAVSDNIPGRGSVIYTLPAEGGVAARVTGDPGAYWHSWSPDGETHALCGKRNGRFDIYTCPASGGPEQQLTGIESDDGHNDGPDYSSDGAWIWFNSDRTGHAQIWKVRPNGSDAHQVFADDHVNWFPHPSPDGEWVLYLAYPPGTLKHPPNVPVALCLMRPDGTERRRVLEFIGGQGTVNVPCWAPDGSAFAYVRYEPQ